jgi:2',3'-cyclic-nucleotide 2'-phosphodiesterase (5'-nucleotidase family)
MTFRDLKSGYPVYLLDRTALKYEQGKVMAVGAPHADLQSGSYGKMLVDVTIQTDGKQNTYSVSDTEQTAYAGSLLITCSKECMINEVRAINTQAEEALSKVAEMQQKVASCKALLEELDTTFKDKQETEKRFRKIDERFSGMEDKMDKILAAINKTKF